MFVVVLVLVVVVAFSSFFTHAVTPRRGFLADLVVPPVSFFSFRIL